MSRPKSFIIDGTEYVIKETEHEPAANLDGLGYVIVRSESAGVFAGYFVSATPDANGTETVVLRNCRRIWCWYGAASISQVAIDGFDQTRSKVPEAVALCRIAKVKETCSVTEKARLCIQGTPPWRV